MGIRQLSDQLDPIRDIVKWLKLGQVKRRYKQLCDHYGLKTVYWSLDTPTRWGMTPWSIKKGYSLSSGYNTIVYWAYE